MVKRGANGKVILPKRATVTDKLAIQQRQQTGKRAAVYFRWSTEDQNIALQDSTVPDWVRAKGYEVVATYTDEAVSGHEVPMQDRLEGGKQLLQDLTADKFDAVFCYKLDRLGRRSQYIISAMDAIEGSKVCIFSKEDGYDSTSASAGFMRNLLSALAEAEWETTRSRTTDGRLAAAEDGRWVQGPLPYGYDFHSDRIPFPSKRLAPGAGGLTEAEVIQKLIYFPLAGFDNEGKAVRRKALWSILKDIWEKQIPSTVRYHPDREAQVKLFRKKSGKVSSGQWGYDKLTAIVRNPLYYGLREIHSIRGLKTYPFPPLVTKAVWDAANKNLEENTLRPRAGKTRLYLLTGKGYCACGRPYYGTIQTIKRKAGVWKKAYYICMSKQDKQQRRASYKPCTANKWLPAEAVEQAIWRKVRAFIEQADYYIDLAGQRLEALLEAENPDTSLRKRLLEDVRELEEKKERALQMALNGLWPMERAKAESDKIIAELATKRVQLEQARGTETMLDRFKEALSTAKSLAPILQAGLDKAETDPELMRAVVDRVLDHFDTEVWGTGHKKGARLTLYLRIGLAQHIEVVGGILGDTLDYLLKQKDSAALTTESIQEAETFRLQLELAPESPA